MKISILLLLLSNIGIAQSTVTGTWKTIDDNTGKEKSIVEIVERGGKIYGKVVRIFPEPGKNPDPVCDKCPTDDPRFKKKVIGMEIIKGLVKNGDEYNDGTILDPEVGKIYRCKIWIEEQDLKVRGYWGFLYRTQTWRKLK